MRHQKRNQSAFGKATLRITPLTTFLCGPGIERLLLPLRDANYGRVAYDW